MRCLRRLAVLTIVLPIVGTVAASPAHADPVTDAVATIGAALAAQSATCASARSLDLRHLSWHVDSTSSPGTIYYVWTDTAVAAVKCPGVRVGIRIRDYAGAGTVNVGGSLIYDTGWCYAANPGTSATVSCPDLRVPYYSAQQIRNTSTVVVDAMAWNQGIQYACRTAAYGVVATPTGPQFTADDVESDCLTTV